MFKKLIVFVLFSLLIVPVVFAQLATLPELPPLIATFTGTDKGAHVTQLQKLLARGGYYIGEPSSVYDEATRDAVARFQVEHNIPTTPETRGFSGPATRAKLNELYASTSKTAETILLSSPTTPSSNSVSSSSGASQTIETLRLTLRSLLEQLITLLQQQLSQVVGTSSTGTTTVETSKKVSTASSVSRGGGGGSSSNSRANGGSQVSAPSTPQPGKIFLTPGTGWSGPTPEPPAQGSANQIGYDAKAIARWDVVPYQTFDTTINVGVVAFHMNDIDRVEFSANGGPWIPVSRMTKNPETNVVEYWLTLRASDFPDGPVELRAIAYPKVGVPRVLAGEMIYSYPDSSGIIRRQVKPNFSLNLYANSGGTLYRPVRYVAVNGSDSTGDGTEARPLATVAQAMRSIKRNTDDLSGGIIYLKPGDYVIDPVGLYRPNFKDNATQFLTISGAPGTNRNQVRIVGGARPFWNNHLHLANLTLYKAPGAINGSGFGTLWVDNVFIESLGLYPGHGTVGAWEVSYFTDSQVNNSQVAIAGAELARNVIVTNAGEDSFKIVNVVINSRVRNVRSDPSVYNVGYHPDIWQYFNLDTTGRSLPLENLIVYGLDAQDVFAQGFGPTGCISCAFVNTYGNTTQIDTQSVLQNIQFVKEMNHFYIKDSCFIGPNNFRDEMDYKARNVVIENSYMANAAGVLNGINSQNIYRSPASSCAEAMRGYLTPAELNVVEKKVSTPTVTPTPGTYQNSVTVTLSSDPGADIHYTTNGTNVGSFSTLYTEPLTFTANARIKARAFKSGWLGSDTLEERFTITDQPVIVPATTTPPVVPNLPRSSQAPGLLSGTVAYFPFDGNLKDGSNSGADGSYAGTPAYESGYWGQAIKLNGTGERISFPMISLGTNHSVSFWINSTVANPGVVLGRTNAGSANIWLLGGNLRYSTVSSNVEVPHNGVTGGWNNFTISRSGPKVDFYKNGSPLGSLNLSLDTALTLDQVGARGGGSSSLNGLLDEVRIYNRALSADEIQTLYQQGVQTKNFASPNLASLYSVLAELGRQLSELLRR